MLQQETAYSKSPVCTLLACIKCSTLLNYNRVSAKTLFLVPATASGWQPEEAVQGLVQALHKAGPHSRLDLNGLCFARDLVARLSCC